MALPCHSCFTRHLGISQNPEILASLIPSSRPPTESLLWKKRPILEDEGGKGVIFHVMPGFEL
jgi:hypothetical protein